MRVLLALILLLAGCGPIGATAVIGDAEIACARAHASDGMKLAPYETTSADLYLQKAKEADGYAHYSLAMDLARKAQIFAENATLRTAQARLGGAPVAPTGATARPVDGLTPQTATPVAPVVAPPPVIKSAPVITPAPSNNPAPATPAAPASKPPPATTPPAAPPRQVIKPANQGTAPLPPAPSGGKQPINPESP